MSKQTAKDRERDAARGVEEEAEQANNGTPAATEDAVRQVREAVARQMEAAEKDAADVAMKAVDELADRAGELEAAQTELATVRDQLLRKAAEFQNYRRRTQQEKEGLVELGKATVVQQLLDPIDDLQRTIEAAGQAGDDEAEPGAAFASLKQGVELVYRKFMDELGRMGVVPIEAVGQPFHEDLHEAVMQQPAPEGTEPGTILHEVQRGYRMGDRVLRHSRVVVAG